MYFNNLLLREKRVLLFFEYVVIMICSAPAVHCKIRHETRRPKLNPINRASFDLRFDCFSRPVIILCVPLQGLPYVARLGKFIGIRKLIISKKVNYTLVFPPFERAPDPSGINSASRLLVRYNMMLYYVPNALLCGTRLGRLLHQSWAFISGWMLGWIWIYKLISW